MLESATRSVTKLGEKIDESVSLSSLPGAGFVTTLTYRIKKTDASKLQDEYAKLVEGLQEAGDTEDGFMTNPGWCPLCYTISQWLKLGFESSPTTCLRRQSREISGRQSTSLRF